MIGWVFRCAMLGCLLLCFMLDMWMLWYLPLLMVARNVTVDSPSSLSPVNGSCLWWQTLHNLCWAWCEFPIPVNLNLVDRKCINFFLWIQTNLFKFICMILLYTSHVRNGKWSYLDLIWWLSASAGPEFASISPDSASQFLTEHLLLYRTGYFLIF